MVRKNRRFCRLAYQSVLSLSEQVNLKSVAYSVALNLADHSPQLRGIERVRYGTGLVCLASALSSELSETDRLRAMSRAELEGLIGYCVAPRFPEWELSRVAVAAQFGELNLERHDVA